MKNLTKKALIGALVTLGLHPLASHSQEEKAFMSSCKQNLQTYAKGMEQNAKVTGYIGMGAHSVSFLSKLCLFFVPQREKEKHNKLTSSNNCPDYFSEIYLPSLQLILENKYRTVEVTQATNKVKPALIGTYEVYNKKWEIMPLTYGLIHVNALSNTVSFLSSLSQAISTTYYSFKMKKQLKTLEGASKTKETCRKVNSQIDAVLDIQLWVTGLTLPMYGFTSFFSICPFGTGDLLKEHPFKMGVLSLLFEASQLFFLKKLTHQITHLSQGIQKTLEELES